MLSFKTLVKGHIMPETFIKKLQLLIFSLFLSVALLNGKSFAADSNRIYETITPVQLISIIQNSGYSAIDGGDNLVIWDILKQKSAIKISDKHDSIVFLFYSKSIKGTFDNANQWNLEKQFSKSFIDDEGDIFLELDLDLSGGISEENIKHFLDLCQISARAFVKTHENQNN